MTCHHDEVTWRCNLRPTLRCPSLCESYCLSLCHRCCLPGCRLSTEHSPGGAGRHNSTTTLTGPHTATLPHSPHGQTRRQLPVREAHAVTAGFTPGQLPSLGTHMETVIRMENKKVSFYYLHLIIGHRSLGWMYSYVSWFLLVILA